MESKVVRWADADKSDDFVKQKLKLNGLSGDALKSNKNYKYFKQFVDIKEGNQRDVWLKQEVSTSDVWTKLGFGNVKTQEELTKASGTDAFQVYLRYADSVDNRAVAKSYNKEEIVPVISVDSSWAEKKARMESWVKANKPAAYVMMVLGLHDLSPAAVKSNKNLKLFAEYLQTNKKSLGNADILLKHLMGLENLSPKAMTNSENYKTYKYLSDLIQNNK
ncbi:RxLR effector protein [Phytophthora megakarya]|uniref:RxLR effector protein n=1 Tax=Phytophthora megakarya TaxID=4795 RepID=A0A225VJL0_9STRA|nr:RxLR effector protein [Phytophthora megakarya]